MKIPLQTVTLRQDIVTDGCAFWHLSDERGRTVMPFLDYMIECIDVASLNPRTVESRAYALKKWYQFLADEQIDALDVNDHVLRKFRAHLMARQAANSSGDEQARRRTVNLDLRNIYSYYAWLQKHEEYGHGRRLLGPSASQITSSLVAERADGIAQAKHRRYPLTFRNAGERSKHRLGFVPREEHRGALIEYFYETQSPSLAKRNCLIFEMAWRVGWRRGSILSLTTEQFSRELTLAATESIAVKPRSQKFGYSNCFHVDISLASRILDYIEHERHELVSQTGSRSVEIFLNEKTGTPLSPRTVSCLFGDARKALGWPAGAGIHGWRRGFVNAYIEREMDARLELGLDTSGDTIAMSVAVALGQESLSSQAAYIRDAQRRIRGAATFRDKEEHARLADENAALVCENAKLRRLLAESETFLAKAPLRKETEASSHRAKETALKSKGSS
ncbi:hypothetical protein PQR46_20440 [Paraburkholderia sediminicola]|uniref:hypothetical protein n=1 Tax=Paraburkholderia sediminicola TaxID=458836 RepID=UPI0038B84D2A